MSPGRWWSKKVDGWPIGPRHRPHAVWGATERKDWLLQARESEPLGLGAPRHRLLPAGGSAIGARLRKKTALYRRGDGRHQGYERSTALAKDRTQSTAASLLAGSRVRTSAT